MNKISTKFGDGVLEVDGRCSHVRIYESDFIHFKADFHKNISPYAQTIIMLSS